jgi:hypothetical protein
MAYLFKSLSFVKFAYIFSHFVWLFPFFRLLSESQQQLLKQKFRVALRLVHCCPFVSDRDLYTMTNEHLLELYVK